MGTVPVGNTHDPRPTGKLFAARWKHEHLRLILLSAILSFAMTILFLLLLHDASARSVTVVDGGKTTVIKTKVSDVRSLLSEHNIVIGPQDEISQPLDAKLEEGSTIAITRAARITLQADGKKEIRYTTADTVRDVLRAANITLSANDRVYPGPTTPITDGMTIQVLRVKKEIVETKHPVTFTIVEKKDGTLLEGKKKVVQSGREGLLVKKFERVYVDGRLVSDQLISKTVAKPAVQKVVAVGTKKKAPEVKIMSYDANNIVKLDGQSVKVKRVLKNVRLTAYSAGPASTGKDVGDEGYGITASGTKVEEGRTIAVDPDVIPLGWWVYIEGIGFRRAEDTGSAIKGKKIDVYFDSEKYANKFGARSGYTVYVIGPVKPSAS